MKEFYNKYFRIPKKDKICETTMLIRIAVMVVIIISCLIAMSVTAYAYYSYNITSSSNNIKSAAFNVKPTITANGESISLEEAQSGVFTADLQTGKSYNIILTRTSESTATTGFCTVTAVKCTEKYYTKQLSASDNSVSFNLAVTANSKITISANWGTSSLYADFITNGDTELYVTNGEAISLNIKDLLNNSMSEPSSAQLENALSTIISKKTTISNDASQKSSALLGLIQSQNEVNNSITDEEQSKTESTEELKELTENENIEQDESAESSNLIN